MKPKIDGPRPDDADARLAVKPVVCYPIDTLPAYNAKFYEQARNEMVLVNSVTVPPRMGGTVEVPKGHFFRIVSVDGSQVGDLNLWNSADLNEKFYSGKTRALHGTHLGIGDCMWSSFPAMRPMATVTADTLAWYGFDEFGGSVHDVIGTRCDPYTNNLLSGGQYHHCCHSNLTRALADAKGLDLKEAETLVHDVLNVFMCTGFTHDTHQYFMKASPVRPNDYLEFFAEIDLLVGLSACPGGDCSSEHSSDEAKCYPLLIEVYAPKTENMVGWSAPKRNGYDQTHSE